MMLAFQLESHSLLYGSNCEGTDEHGNRPHGEDIQKRTYSDSNSNSNSGGEAAAVEVIAIRKKKAFSDLSI